MDIEEDLFDDDQQPHPEEDGVLKEQCEGLIPVLKSMENLDTALAIKLTGCSCSKHHIDKEFGFMRDCTELKFFSSSIRSISGIDLLTNLVKLNMEKNKLYSLPESFANLTRLRDLNLDNNRFSKIPEILYQMPEITNLSLAHNYIKELDEQVEQLTSLRLLDLKSNQLESCPSQVVNLPELNELVLGQNQLTRLPATKKGCQLKYLDLSRNRLTVFPKLENAPLEKLDLSQNRIQIIPESITKLTKLTVLDLDRNVIRHLTPLILQLTHLVEINCRNNYISNRLDYTQLPELEHLDLQFNDLDDLLLKAPSQKSRSKLRLRLKSLVMCGNSIRKLSPSLTLFQSLETVNFSRCNLVNIDPICELTNLERLFLSRNMLVCLPKGISKLTRLTVLDLDGNQLETLPIEIGNLPLRRLYLCHNRLKRLPVEINGLRQLEELDISSNYLRDIGLRVAMLAHLRTLYAHDNRFVYIHPAFQRLLSRGQQNVYEDRQNVHNTEVQESVRTSIYNILKDPVSRLVKKDRYLKDIEKSNLRETTKTQLREYIENPATFIAASITYGELFQYVWTRIVNNPDPESLVQVLQGQLDDSIGLCFTGQISRLIGTLDGFYSDIRIGIGKADQLGIFYTQSEGKVRQFLELALGAGYTREELKDWIEAFGSDSEDTGDGDGDGD